MIGSEASTTGIPLTVFVINCYFVLCNFFIDALTYLTISISNLVNLLFYICFSFCKKGPEVLTFL